MKPEGRNQNSKIKQYRRLPATCSKQPTAEPRICLSTTNLCIIALWRRLGSQACGSQAAGERGERELNSVFSGLSSDIQNNLIKSIAQVIRDNFAKFVSVIADETPDISHREQMSVIFRYLTKTGIEERFVGFFDVTLERGADQLSQSIEDSGPIFDLDAASFLNFYLGLGSLFCARSGFQFRWRYRSWFRFVRIPGKC
ncbi:hypothetical protein EVAR_49937_1 [Eumeta japonica]|uniref:Uncharacterized protein n=1 Tax=Eumeta variegata TaxID=151549 RepID=A0A4C1XVD2_EUMVA|nr:hypothetical protein EVAR_49937_1 [Eumeta japonica]